MHSGIAGIINIVLKQNVDLGLSGGLTLSASTADRYVASGNVGYQRGPAIEHRPTRDASAQPTGREALVVTSDAVLIEHRAFARCVLTGGSCRRLSRHSRLHRHADQTEHHDREADLRPWEALIHA